MTEKDLGATASQSLAVEISELREWQEEAREAMFMALGALGGHARGFAQEALIRCCVLVGSDPEDWTYHPETMRRRRALLPERYQQTATAAAVATQKGSPEDGS